jgi:hypothetical protein
MPRRGRPRRASRLAWALGGALLIGAAPDRPAAAPGPAAAAAAAAPPQAPPTFTRDVAPILHAKCLNCHRQKQAGPFPLETYEQARKRAADIATVVIDQSMPPWKPQAGVGPKLKHDSSLTPAEIEVINAWAEAGAPPGDPKDLPPTPRFAEGWARGEPDLVLEPAESFAIPAGGPDVYRCFVLPTNLVRETYVAMIDFRPANPRVVHHITAYIDTTGAARRRDAADPGSGYTSFTGPGIPLYDMLGFWAAGHSPIALPEGVGLPLPRQGDVVLQIHYHPTGKPEVDRTRLGLYLAKGPVKQALHWNAAQNFQFRLAPGAREAEVRASWYVPIDLEAVAVSPHMHQLGRDIRMSLTRPDGRTVDLISIPDWDPAWQSMYHFQDRIPLPRGSTVHVLAHFDNGDHARNPSRPPRPVRWGHNVEDEMCDGFIAVVKKGQDLTQPGAVDDLAGIFAQQRLRNLRRDRDKRQP